MLIDDLLDPNTEIKVLKSENGRDRGVGLFPKARLLSAVAYRCDNIVQHCEQSTAVTLEDVQAEYPCLAPPAPCVFFEWCGGVAKRLGVLLETIYRGSDGWQLVLTPFAGGRDGRYFAITVIHDRPVETDTGLPGSTGLTLDGLGAPKGLQLPRDPKIGPAALAPCLFALSLLHCKNVRVISDRVPDRLQVARRRRGKLPLLNVKTLVLDLPSTRTVSAERDRSPSPRNDLRVHLVRGHFADYRERPLFGKHRGIYFVPMHARGNPRRGIIFKDYDVRDAR